NTHRPLVEPNGDKDVDVLGSARAARPSAQGVSPNEYESHFRRVEDAKYRQRGNEIGDGVGRERCGSLHALDVDVSRFRGHGCFPPMPSRLEKPKVLIDPFFPGREGFSAFLTIAQTED